MVGMNEKPGDGEVEAAEEARSVQTNPASGNTKELGGSPTVRNLQAKAGMARGIGTGEVEGERDTDEYARREAKSENPYINLKRLLLEITESHERGEHSATALDFQRWHRLITQNTDEISNRDIRPSTAEDKAKSEKARAAKNILADLLEDPDIKSEIGLRAKQRVGEDDKKVKTAAELEELMKSNILKLKVYLERIVNIGKELSKVESLHTSLHLALIGHREKTLREYFEQFMQLKKEIDGELAKHTATEIESSKIKNLRAAQGLMNQFLAGDKIENLKKLHDQLKTFQGISADLSLMAEEVKKTEVGYTDGLEEQEGPIWACLTELRNLFELSEIEFKKPENTSAQASANSAFSANKPALATEVEEQKSPIYNEMLARISAVRVVEDFTPELFEFLFEFHTSFDPKAGGANTKESTALKTAHRILEELSGFSDINRIQSLFKIAKKNKKKIERISAKIDQGASSIGSLLIDTTSQSADSALADHASAQQTQEALTDQAEALKQELEEVTIEINQLIQANTSIIQKYLNQLRTAFGLEQIGFETMSYDTLPQRSPRLIKWAIAAAILAAIGVGIWPTNQTSQDNTPKPPPDNPPELANKTKSPSATTKANAANSEIPAQSSATTIETNPAATTTLRNPAQASAQASAQARRGIASSAALAPSSRAAGKSIRMTRKQIAQTSAITTAPSRPTVTARAAAETNPKPKRPVEEISASTIIDLGLITAVDHLPDANPEIPANFRVAVNPQSTQP